MSNTENINTIEYQMEEGKDTFLTPKVTPPSPPPPHPPEEGKDPTHTEEEVGEATPQ